MVLKHTKNRCITRQKLVSCVLSFFLIASPLAFFPSCASTQVEEAPQLGVPEDFTKRELSNGIPVVFKQNRGSKIVVCKVVFEGGTSAIDANLGGIEKLSLDLMLRGSEKYPYSKIQQVEYENSVYLSDTSGKEFSTLGFMCIQRDMSLALDMLSECIVNPSLSEGDFKQKMAEISSSIANRKADPSGALGLAISKAVFNNHPYGTTATVTEESYKNINLPLVHGIHQSLVNALRMKIVVVGNFSFDLIESFTASLEEKFGSISKKAYSAPKIPKISINGSNVFVGNEQAGNTGYIAGLFEYPRRDSEECIPLAIAAMYIDDLFFSQVREKAGATYSINIGALGGQELLGVIEVFKATEKKQLKQLIFNAISSFDEATIEKKLNQYKNRYISSIFSSSQTAGGVASSIIASMEYFNSETAYLKRPDLVEAVTSAQVIAAFKKYIEPVVKENAIKWVVVDGEENLGEYDF